MAVPEVPQTAGEMWYGLTLTASADVHVVDIPHLWDQMRLV